MVNNKFAEVYSKKHGNFSIKLARNLIEYLKTNFFKVKRVLDVGCGTGEFVSILRNNCEDCTGLDISEDMISYAKVNVPDVKFVLGDMRSFNLKQKFDLISCNYHTVNYLGTIEEWQKFFQNVYNHLGKGCLFIFDFTTKTRLENWFDTIFEISDEIDFVSQISQDNDNKCVFNDIYYLKQAGDYYRRVTDINVLSFFDNKEVFDTLRKVGFEDMQFFNTDFKPLTDAQLIKQKNILVVCRK